MNVRPLSDAAPAGRPALSAVPSTLRIPLAARALGDALFPQVAMGDRRAAALLAALGDDGSQWLRDRHSIYGSLARARRFRDLAQRFLKAQPGALAVNLGCGLSDYFQWLDDGQARMIDADLPDVIALRRQLMPAATERDAMREVDLTAPDWWDALGLPSTRAEAPLFMQAEGVFMYLRPDTVQSVLRCFGERAPAGSVFVFDAMCWLVAGRAKRHPSVRHTDAEFQWGPRRLAELTAPSPRLRLEAVHRIMEGYGLPYTLIGPAFRAVFKVPFYAVYELHARDG